MQWDEGARITTMDTALQIYIPGNSLVHRGDARVKLVLLLAASISVFLIQQWAGLGILAVFVLAALINARLPLRKVCKLSIPLFIILGLVWLFNAFALDVNNVAQTSGLANVSAGFMEGWAPVALIGTFGFVPEGCMRGLFYASRIILILWASFAVSFTTTSNELADAFVSFMAPLKRTRFPVDDAAMVLTIALRFIPFTADEFMRIRAAQISRGAGFEQGGLFQRMRSWFTVLVPLFVAMFRNANHLAAAMDARCYGAGERTRLHDARMNPTAWVALLVGLALIVALCVAF